MPQHDYNIANASGAVVRADINDALSAAVTLNSGPTAPVAMHAHMLWADTTASQLRQRNAANSAWVEIGVLGAANLGLAPLSSPTFTGNPTAPTAAPGNNTTQLATTAFVAGASDARSYRTLNGRAIVLDDNTNIEAWADTLPPSGIYDVHLTAPQGNLPVGWWYLELLVHSGSAPTNLHSTITATLLVGASGIKFSNTRISTGWGGWVQMVPIAATETVSGIAELATGAEAAAGTDAARIVTPAALRAGLNASGSAPIFACRAWVNFNGTGTVAIRASGNVSSITDNGLGDYTVNLQTALPDANFSAVVGGPNGSNGTNITVLNVTGTTASTVRIVQSGTGTGGGGTTDASLVSLAVFR